MSYSLFLYVCLSIFIKNYFTSSKIYHADYQLFTFTWDKYGLLLR